MKGDAPEHEKIGRIQPKLLSSIGLKNRIIDEKNWQENCKWALECLKKGIPIALVVRRETLE
ncbi:MAG: hypothetical protein CL763_08795 [Chloroflexi bacterium]|nr:hypothetical protein [Chloroflexota bacterium]